MSKYRFVSNRIIDGKLRKVIVDIYGNIINRMSIKEELKGLKSELSKEEIYDKEEYCNEFLKCEKECLLEILRKFEREEGRPATENDFSNNPKYPSFAIYRRVFGSWNDAIIDAGFKTNSGGNKQRKYKIRVSFDEKNFFWVVYDRDKLMMKTTNEDLEEIKLIKYYNHTNVCPTCREEWKNEDISKLTDKSILYPGNTMRDTNKNGNKTNIWICIRHGQIQYARNNPDSYNNIFKINTGCRSGNLDSDCSTAKGILGVRLTCSLFGVKSLDGENNNYKSPVDHSPISGTMLLMIGEKLVYLSEKILQSKTKWYDSKNCFWYFHFSGRRNLGEKNKKTDYVVCYCISEDGKIVERIYIIPKKEVIKQNGISIVKNPKNVPLYEKYKVTDSEFLKITNETWQEIIKGD